MFLVLSMRLLPEVMVNACALPGAVFSLHHSSEALLLTALPAVLHFPCYSPAVSLVVGEKEGTLAKILIKPQT